MSRSPESIGKRGSYELLSLVLERGLFATYEARHVELARRALVRTLAPSVTPTARLEDALLAEAQVLAKLHHPSVIGLYEVLREDGRLYVVLEHPLGPALSTIEEKLAPRGGLTTDEALAVVLAAAQAVAHVHEQGYVHGLISSKTVFVGTERGLVVGGFDRVHDASKPAAVERSGLDPAYLAPEELMDEPPTKASDVFALGVLAYEALTGHHPFGPPGPDVAQRVRTVRPPAMTASRRVPVDVERAVMRALSKQPGLRQADASELVRDLEGALGTEVPVAPRIAAFTARAGLGKGTSSGGAAADVAAPTERRALDVAVRLGALLAVMVGLAVAVEVAERSGRPAAAAITSSSAPGYVRVLAHPWAEIWIDGVARDTTPVARPFEVSAGRHTLVFKHPRASDERRVVDVQPGEVVSVDVEMRVVAPPVDAGIDASP